MKNVALFAGVLTIFATAPAKAELAYQGGSVQTVPTIRIAFYGWGAISGNCTQVTGTAPDPLGFQANFQDYLAAATGSRWFEVVTQYSESSPTYYTGNQFNQFITDGVTGRSTCTPSSSCYSFWDRTLAPTNPSVATIANYAYNVATAAPPNGFGLTTNLNTVILVVGNCQQTNPNPGAAWHGVTSPSGFTYIFKQYGGRTSDLVHHELNEAATDPGYAYANPSLSAGWQDSRGFEIGDLCEPPPIGPDGTSSNWWYPPAQVQLAAPPGGSPGTRWANQYYTEASWSNEVARCQLGRAPMSSSNPGETWIASGALNSWPCGSWSGIFPGITMVNRPAGVSWGPNRVDLVAFDSSGGVRHGYQGSTCSNRGGDSLGTPMIGSTGYQFNWMVDAYWNSVPNSPDISSNGDNNLSVWGVAAPSADPVPSYTKQHLFERRWDYGYGGWVDRGYPNANGGGTNYGISSGVGAVSWGVSDVTPCNSLVYPYCQGTSGAKGGQVMHDAFVLDGQSPPRLWDLTTFYSLGTQNNPGPGTTTATWSLPGQPALLAGYVLAGDPDACSWGSERLDVFVNSKKASDGTPGDLWHMSFDGTPYQFNNNGASFRTYDWGDWGAPAGWLIQPGSRPTCTALGDAHLYVDVLATNNGSVHAFRNEFKGSGLVGWMDLGSVSGRSSMDLYSW